MRCPFAVWMPSPNFHAGRPRPPSFAVIHIADGGPKLTHTVEHLSKPAAQVSAHFVVGRDGTIVQLVDTDDIAWHCKGWNEASIGIEHVARTPREIRSWSSLPLAHRKALLETDGDAASEADPGLALTRPQLSASSRLTSWLCHQYEWLIDREHLRAHREYPGTTHLDCGRDIDEGGIWPWTEYLALVGAAANRGPHS